MRKLSSTPYDQMLSLRLRLVIVSTLSLVLAGLFLSRVRSEIAAVLYLLACMAPPVGVWVHSSDLIDLVPRVPKPLLYAVSGIAFAASVAAFVLLWARCGASETLQSGLFFAGNWLLVGGALVIRLRTLKPNGECFGD